MHWQAQLAHAADERNLLCIVNDFLATWSPSDIAQLPPTSRPGRVKSGEEIRHWSERLAETFCEARADTSPEHHKMLAFFLAAVQRQCTLEAKSAGLRDSFLQAPPSGPPARGAGAAAA